MDIEKNCRILNQSFKEVYFREFFLSLNFQQIEEMSDFEVKICLFFNKINDSSSTLMHLTTYEMFQNVNQNKFRLQVLFKEQKVFIKQKNEMKAGGCGPKKPELRMRECFILLWQKSYLN